MLFNWIKCNNYSITIGTEKRKQLIAHCSPSDKANIRPIQNNFRGLKKSELFRKYKKTDLACKNNKAYETTYTYKILFTVSQQKVN